MVTTYEEANKRLLETGRFQPDFYGPSGFCPVQAWGTLVTGEEVFFRSRGTRASLEVRKGDRMVYHTVEVVDVWPHAGYLSAERSVELMLRFLDRYAQEGPLPEESPQE